MPRALSLPLARKLLWTGPVLVLGTVIGLVFLTGFLPPPSPSDSSAAIVARFRDNETSIRAGCLVLMVVWTLWFTWATVIAAYVRRTESGVPLLTYVTVALVGAGYIFFAVIPLTWAVAAFRPGSVGAGVTQTLNDWAWFDFLFTWVPFSLLCVVIAVAILNDPAKDPWWPRWVAYLNLWCALLLAPAGFIVFFKTGPLAWNGIGAFWIPFSAFLGWIVTMTLVTLRAISREQRQHAGMTSGVEPVPVVVST